MANRRDLVTLLLYFYLVCPTGPNSPLGVEVVESHDANLPDLHFSSEVLFIFMTAAKQLGSPSNNPTDLMTAGQAA